MIRNIIFDLGGVILNLNHNLTIDAFRQYGIHLDEIYTTSSIFTDYETGKVSDEEFRKYVMSITNTEISDKNFDEAWNAMILDLPVHRFEVLKTVSENYNTFLLSNTNNLHLQYIKNYFKTTYPDIVFESYFNKVYYSHQIGMRKPDLECFEYVIKNNNLDPQHTLFIDDSEINLKGASVLGIKTMHAQKPIDLTLVDTIKSFN